MRVPELKTLITDLHALLQDGGANKTTLSGVQEFIALLDDQGDVQVEELIEKLKSLPDKNKINEFAVRKHVKHLNAAGKDPDLFVTAFDRLSADKSVSVTDMDMIFKQYHAGAAWREIYGEKLRHSSRPKALAAIKSSFVERATSPSRSTN